MLAIVTLVCLTLFSCAKEDPVVNNNTPVNIPTASLSTYTGSLNYTSSAGQVISSIDGTATIQKSGSAYKISFSDNVPELSNLIFKDEDGSYASMNTSGSMSGIVIDELDLDVGVLNEGNTWSFSGTK